jgi:hypothetical protein
MNVHGIEKNIEHQCTRLQNVWIQPQYKTTEQDFTLSMILV